ncbi:MAG: apolipoprotein N-acyltransferase [Candidatus Omnitrophota bacterium]
MKAFWKNKDFIPVLISALLLIFSFPDYGIWIFAWVGFVPLFFALENKPRGRAFLLSYLAGVIFWSGTIYWLAHVTFFGTVLLILYLALYFGLFGLIFSAYRQRPAAYGLFFLPSIWVLLEYNRSHFLTGFPWALLGYSQYLNLPVIQIADITGVWGVSFLIMLVNVLIYQAMGHRPWAIDKKQSILTVFFLLVACLMYGFYKLHLRPTAYAPSPIKISVIQPNIEQELKWSPGAREYIRNKYSALTQKAAEDKPDMIIWPEAALPGVLGEDDLIFNELLSLHEKIRTPLLLGAVVYQNDNYFNSALLIDDKGKIVKRYDKLHLVPFGEYIPLKNIFRFLETIAPIGDIQKGSAFTVFTLSAIGYRPSANFSVLICFEDLFPELSSRFVMEGAAFLINVTNDAWYKKTSAAKQHFQASVFRAVENRVNLIRSANTGVSGFIASTGRIISVVKDKAGSEIFVDGYKTEALSLSPVRRTIYNRFPDSLILFSAVLAIYVIILTFKNPKSEE